MKVKIFCGFGESGIKNVEAQVNEWLSVQENDIRVNDTQTTMCQVGDASGERYQCFVTSIWYSQRPEPRPVFCAATAQ